MKKVVPFFCVILLTLTAISPTYSQSDSTTRPYHLGFTPFPYDISQEAVDFVYDALENDSDIIAHHFDSGVPWEEALNNEPFAQEMLLDWLFRKSSTPDDHKIYLAITPINWDRDGLALYRGAQEDMPLPAPWDSYEFNHPDVKTAFVNYAMEAIDYFEPDYVAIGIEVNLLLNNAPEKWESYLELHQYAYTELKAQYPDLPIFVSFFGLSFIEGIRDEDDTPAHLVAFDETMPYSDYFGISLYPYLSAYMTTLLPDTMFTTIFDLTDKPIAITETGYPAETLDLPTVGLVMESDADKQNDYLTKLLRHADEYEFVFVINFVLRDYDALWEKIGGGDIAAVWRDTGLYDENGEERIALEMWRNTLARPYER